MKRNNQRALVAAIVLGAASWSNAFADASAMANEADGLVRDAEKMMHGGKSTEADQSLVKALRLIDQVKSDEPSNKLILRVEKKYSRVRDDVNKTLQQPVATGASASYSKAGASKLPGGVSKRLHDISKLLDDVENNGLAYKLNGARDLFAEIDRTYGGKFDPLHPDYVTAKERLDRLANASQQQKAAKAQGEAKAQTSASTMETQSAEWVKKFQAYLAFPGNEGHNPDKLVYVPGTSEADKFADAQRRYDEFKKFYTEYKTTAFPHGKNWKLTELADREAPSRIETFETQFAQRQASAWDDAMKTIETAMSQLKADNGWRRDNRIKPPLVDRTWMETIKQQVAMASTALGNQSDKSRQLHQSFEQLVAADGKNREIRKQRTFMEPDKYRGADIEEIRQKATSLVAADRKEGGTPLRTTVVSADWNEETAWEWTDTAKTAKRWRTTRGLSSQVAAKTANGVRLITVAIAKDKQSDGSWGPLYGNLHQYSDPMLEENVRKSAP